MALGSGLENLPLASLLVDSSGYVLDANHEAVVLLGQSLEAPAGNLSKIFGTGWLADLTEGRSMAARRIDGAQIEVLGFAKRGSEGRLLISLVDVTVRARRERELAELSLFPLLNPSPVLRFDSGGRVILANPAALRLFRADSLKGASWTEICPGMTSELWKTITESSGPVMHFTAVGDEDVDWAHVRAKSGEFVSAFGNLVTDLKQAQRDLERKAAQLADVARFPDMNPGPVIRTDGAGNILLANRAAREVFGRDLEAASWLEICPAVGAEVWSKVLVAPDTLSVEARIDGRDWMFTHRRDHQTGMVFVYGADVSQQKRVETALRQSEKMATLGTLAAGVAHELNNPAAATRRAAEQLLQKLAKMGEATPLGSLANTTVGAPVAVLVERMRKSIGQIDTTDAMARSDRETQLEGWLAGHGVSDPWDIAGNLAAAGVEPSDLEPLADVLDGPALDAAITWAGATYEIMSLAHVVGHGAARISEIVGALKGYAYLGRAPIQEIDIRDGIENTLVIMRNKLKYGIVVNKDYAADVPPIPAYGSELNQVWTNLIDNAADAMSESGELTIRTRSDAEFVIVEIEDTGSGIPPEARGRVFDPFFTTKPPGKGLGLGLSTTYSIIVDKHGGQISVDSRPGKTTFTVKLPLRHRRADKPR